MSPTPTNSDPDLSYIEPQLRSLAIPIGEIKVDPANVRTHSTRNLELLRTSLSTYRQQKPVVILEDGTLVAGEGMLTAAVNLGWTHVAAIRTTLTGNEAKAYAIVDNQTSDLSEFDVALLEQQLNELAIDGIDMDDLGFLATDSLFVDAHADDEPVEIVENVPVEPQTMTDRFLVPPLTVLDSRQGYWRERHRAWLSLGIKSEAGRSIVGETVIGHASDGMSRQLVCDLAAGGSGPSVFSPVLCEIAYRWWCPEGGQVVDPFSGGSVRGIVASKLGRRYWGCDLSREQIAANEEQAASIVPEAARVPVAVSGPMLRQMFRPCEPDFIKSVCLGRCCHGSSGLSVIVHPSEQQRIETLGVTVTDGFIVADSSGLCPLKTTDGLCSQHDSKPLGCKASPFTFNDSGLLVVRNRYRLLKCFKAAGAVPAYIAHRWSLDQLFGSSEASRIADAAERGDDRISATMPAEVAAVLADNHNARNAKTLHLETPQPEWKCGDAMDELEAAPLADFVFSCPPYGDLEKYSDDPRDLSSMEWHTFAAEYGRIILRAVKQLKDDRFACFVVGNFRDAKGYYRDLVGLTVRAFEDAGAKFYNEAIYVTPIAGIRFTASRNFSTARKLGKVHQNVLVFVKGDAKAAVAACGDVVVAPLPAENDWQS